jgi:hypothetical protein
MKRIFLGALVALFLLGTAFIGGCDESVDSVCARACGVWEACGAWNPTDCMAQCTAEGDWDEYADCVEQAPTCELDRWCDD